MSDRVRLSTAIYGYLCPISALEVLACAALVPPEGAAGAAQSSFPLSAWASENIASMRRLAASSRSSRHFA